MSERVTPGRTSHHGLRRARWIAAGASVGAAVVLGGTIAVVHPASSTANGTTERTGRKQRLGDRDRAEIADDEFEPARPFTPRPPASPALRSSPQPHTTSRGS
jgi:hypothetical protein